LELNEVLMHSPEVVGQVIEEEAVLVHPTQGKVRVLNPVGARLWELTDGTRSLADLAGVLVAEYDVDLGQAQADVLAFCTDLVERGLLQDAS
jgi:hypothetical protein